MGQDDFQRKALDWAFEIAEGVTACGAAGIHTMNFGMPPELINEFLTQIRDRAQQARLDSLNTTNIPHTSSGVLKDAPT